MTITSKEFLKKIGPRPLTDEEVRELRLLRISEGSGGVSGLIDAINEDDIEEKNEKH